MCNIGMVYESKNDNLAALRYKEKSYQISCKLGK
jgi:hypothetical protein